jgi:hypothetical protein
MTEPATPSPDSALPPPIDSRTNWVQALLWGFDAAMDAGARQIVCADPDFALWPLDDARLHGALAAWLRRPQRRLVLLAAHYDDVPRLHPRFMAWRRDWVHAMSTLAAPEELAAGLPMHLVDDTDVSVQLFDATHWRGRAQRDGRTAHLLRQETDVLLQRSAPAFALSVLGL